MQIIYTHLRFMQQRFAVSTTMYQVYVIPRPTFRGYPEFIVANNKCKDSELDVGNMQYPKRKHRNGIKLNEISSRAPASEYSQDYLEVCV